MITQNLAYFITGCCSGIFVLGIAIFALAACKQSSDISREEENATKPLD